MLARMSAWLVLSAIAILAPARAESICVNTDGSGGCLTSLQAAVDAAGVNEIVSIAPGTYSPDVPGVITIPRRLAIQGSGRGVTIIDAHLVVAYGVRGGNVSDVTVLDGVFAERGNLYITRCEIDGGGVSNAFGASGERVILTDSLVTGFPRYGTIAENLTMVRSTVVGNGGGDGGGVRILKRGRITQSTISGNHSNGSGGGIWISAPGRLLLTDSTVSGNSAAQNGGGLFVEGSSSSAPAGAILRRSTIAANSAGLGGGGVYVESDFRPGKLTVEASIVADNVSPSGADCNATSPVLAGRENLIEDTSGCLIAPRPHATVLSLDPMLGPLQNNGGTTETQALLAGSPALAQVTAGAFCKAPDQRGVARTAPCDIGAFEAP